MTIKRILIPKLKECSEWLDHQEEQFTPPFYSSVDVRKSLHKVVGVDTNLFPAGFNNLCQKSLNAGAVYAGAFIAKHYGDIRRIILLAEAHTRNTFYHASLVKLKDILTIAGYEVRIALPGLEGETPFTIKSMQGEEEVPLVEKEGGHLQVGDFVAQLALLNNDLSGGYPELEGITTPLTPPLRAGWQSRKKSDHLQQYDKVMAQFGEDLSIDPWLFSAEWDKVTGVDIAEGEGLDAIAEGTEKVLARIKTKYKEYGIKEEPVVFIKNNSGTYGMGILTLKHGEDIFTINRKLRNKMKVGKNALAISELLIQEGIPTACEVEGESSEPVIYLIGNHVIGGFFRTNSEKGVAENLNSKGMGFSSFCKSIAPPVSDNESQHCYEGRKSFGIITVSARLSALAAAREMAPLFSSCSELHA